MTQPPQKTLEDYLKEFDNLPQTKMTTREWLEKTLKEVSEGMVSEIEMSEMMTKEAGSAWEACCNDQLSRLNRFLGKK